VPLVYPALLASLDTILQAHTRNSLLHASYASRSSRKRLSTGPIRRNIQDRESGLPRIPIPRTSVNKEKKNRRVLLDFAPSHSSRPLPHWGDGELVYVVLVLLTASSVILSTSAEASSCFR
jgi:hypothetical protein